MARAEKDLAKEVVISIKVLWSLSSNMLTLIGIYTRNIGIRIGMPNQCIIIRIRLNLLMTMHLENACSSLRPNQPTYPSLSTARVNKLKKKAFLLAGYEPTTFHSICYAFKNLLRVHLYPQRRFLILPTRPHESHLSNYSLCR